MRRTALVGAILISLAATESLANEPQQVEEIDNRQRIEILTESGSRTRGALALDPQRRVVISGTVVWPTWFLSTRELVFEPGATLVFGRLPPDYAGRLELVADRIVIRDPQQPGVITWSRPEREAPREIGQAATGSPGRGIGAGGGQGAQGEQGLQGSQGADAPDIEVFVRTIATGTLVVDFAGSDGGQGGVGQRGGQGGPGTQGESSRTARQSLPFGGWTYRPWCDAGPGHGGPGGPGGRGGDGGVGGTGGRGGDVTLTSDPESIERIRRAIRVVNRGGEGGPGGGAGLGGLGGAGGPVGPVTRYCTDPGDRHGAAGGPGGSGQAGQRGTQGSAGQQYFSQLTAAQFAALFGF